MSLRRCELSVVSGFTRPNPLEFDVQVGGKEVVLVGWIDPDGKATHISSGTEIVIVPPTVGIG
jgi:hypothetical protein